MPKLRPSDFTDADGGDFAEGDFPGVDLKLILRKWLSHVKDEDPPVQRAYVNWRGNRHIARRMNRQFSRIDVEGKGTGQRLLGQIQKQFEIAERLKANVPAHLVALVEGRQPKASADTPSDTSAFEPVLSRR